MFVDLTQYLWILWLALVILFVVVELLTFEFTFLMLSFGTLIGGLGGNLLGAPWWAQIAAAAVISALLLFTIRPALLRLLRKGGDPAASNLDRLQGIGGTVYRDFDRGAGQVRLDNGEIWTARLGSTASNTALDEGDRVVVVLIDGATAEVAPAPPPAADAAS